MLGNSANPLCVQTQLFLIFICRNEKITTNDWNEDRMPVDRAAYPNTSHSYNMYKSLEQQHDEIAARETKRLLIPRLLDIVALQNQNTKNQEST